MQSTKINGYQIRKYQSSTYKASSRPPLSINKNNYTTVQRKGISDFSGNKKFTLDDQSIIDSLNLAIRNRNYYYEESIPDLNIIYYDSNLRKYRHYSATIKKSANDLNVNSLNLENKQNLFKAKLSTGNTNTKYNQDTSYNNKTINYRQINQNQYGLNKSSTWNKNQMQNMKNINNKYSNSTNSNIEIKNNLNHVAGSCCQTFSKNDNNGNNNQERRINSYPNRTIQNQGFNKYNISNKNDNNKNIYRNNTSNMINKTNQGRNRNDNDSKYLLNNKTQSYSNNIKSNINNQMDQGRRGISELKNYIINKNPSSNTTNINRTNQQNQGRRNDEGRIIMNKAQTSNMNNNQTNQGRRINSEQKNYLMNKTQTSNTDNLNQRNQGRKNSEGSKIDQNKTQTNNLNQINQGRRRNDEGSNIPLNKTQTNNRNNINQARGRSEGVNVNRAQADNNSQLNQRRGRFEGEIQNKTQTNNISQVNQNRGRTEEKQLLSNRIQTNNYNNVNQGGQNRRRNAEEDKKLLLNRVQKSQERNIQDNKNSIPNLYQSRKIYQEDIGANNATSNARRNVNANTNINNPAPTSEANKTYTHKINQSPIPNNRSIQKDYHLEKDIKDLTALDLQQELQKLKSPFKAEEIVKDENGEIIQIKEEKTIAIIPGQKIEPKSIIETFEKPTIEIIQNEDGTSQSVIKQKKIITAIENIPIQSGIKNKDDLQLVKQIITHEYKTFSATKDDLNKEGNKEGNDEENNGENKEENNELNKENEENNGEKIEKNINENEQNEEKIGEKGDNNELQGQKEKEKDTLTKKKGDSKKDKKMRYMDIVSDENAKDDNAQKNNKGIVDKKKSDINKNVASGENQKNKGKAKEQNKNKDEIANQKDSKKKEALAQNANKKQETSSKAKNIKSGLTEKESIASKTNEKSSLANAQKEKSGNAESINKKLDTTKSKEKAKANKEKATQEANNKELNSNVKKGKVNEESDLRKPFRKNKNEEKDNKQLNASENIKMTSELYEKCFKAGNKTNKEKEMAKIVEIIIPLGEKESKEILAKLLKSFPKSSELNQKLLKLISAKISSTVNTNAKSKGKQAEMRASAGKEKSKETRSQSQMKSSGIKSNKLAIEEGIAKTEINQRIKLERTDDKFASLRLSDKYGINSALNGLGGYSTNTANIGNLKFDGLFLDISKYQNTERYKNPFEGPSSFYKFYKMRQSQIKKKIIDMTIESKNN